MSKKLLFRADGNYNIGLGHYIRTFALIEMINNKFKCLLLTRSNSLKNVIPKKYEKKNIPNHISLKSEPKWIIENFSPDEYIIIIDGYNFVNEYQKELKTKGFKIIYVDDLIKKKLYADIVINHSLNAKEKDFNNEIKTKYALGPEYALLRPEFIKVSKKNKKIKTVEELFICFGGADHNDITNTALEGVLEISKISKINIVLGTSYNHKKIFKTLKKRKKDIRIYKDIGEKEMIKVMERCQLAIVPSSTIMYEVCCVKMLILGGYYIKNQISIYEGLKSNGLIYAAENFKNLNPEGFKNFVLKILNDDYKTYSNFIKNQSRFFDGNQKLRFNKLISTLC